jgi:DNA-binding CsgD family transcriptional regulator
MSAPAATVLERPAARRPAARLRAIAPSVARAVPTPGDDVAAFSALVGDIYDAAVDPARWSAVLARVHRFVGGCAAAIAAKDASTKGIDLYFECGAVDPRYTRLYFDTYRKLDPLTTGHVLAEIEQPVCTGDVMPYEDFYQTRFYREWARPQGFVDFVTAVLDRSTTGAAMIGIFRSDAQGLVDDDTRWRMRQVVPHIRRAVLIGRAIELKSAEAAGFADTLDGLSAGMFLVDAGGRIVHANAAGLAMLSDGDLLRGSGGRFVAADPGAAAALGEIFAAAGAGDAALGVKGISVPLTGRDGSCYAAHVLPLTSGARRRAGARYAATAAVFVRKAEMAATSPPEAIARHYGLTPTELRVLLAIVQVGGVPETAEALGVGEATVKTHLHRLFGKTGTARQADLVKLVAGFANPLVD